MLFCLADHEVGLAERAAELQRPYRSPNRWSLTQLTWSTFEAEIIARQRVVHEAWQDTLRCWQAGDKDATEFVIHTVNMYARVRRRAPIDLTEFEPVRPKDAELQRFNPSRAILGLEQRGFVLRDHYWRHANLALTVEGFAEARRLGGVTDSEIVDLDRVAANWRDPADFALGIDDLWRDDGLPPRDTDYS
jgi:hypothetical protein